MEFFEKRSSTSTYSDTWKVDDFGHFQNHDFSLNSMIFSLNSMIFFLNSMIFWTKITPGKKNGFFFTCDFLAK